MTVTLTIDRIVKTARGGVVIADSSGNSVLLETLADVQDFAADAVTEDALKRVVAARLLAKSPDLSTLDDLAGRTLEFDPVQNIGIIGIR